jgi:hypothetical protein
MDLPPPNSRVAFVGPTRSGKTYLARAWLRAYDHVAILDPKRQFSWRSRDPRFSRYARSWNEFRRMMERSERDGWPVVYQPPPDALLPQNADQLDQFYWYCLRRGDTLTYTDELYFIANGSNFAVRAPWFFRAVTTGASQGVGVWSAFQRPSWIPLIAITETEVRALFYLRHRADRETIESCFGPVEWEALRRERHAFALSTDDWTSGPIRLRATANASEPGAFPRPAA